MARLLLFASAREEQDSCHPPRGLARFLPPCVRATQSACQPSTPIFWHDSCSSCTCAGGRARPRDLARVLLLRAQARATLPVRCRTAKQRLILACQVPPSDFIFVNLFEGLGLETVFYFGYFWPPTLNFDQGVRAKKLEGITDGQNPQMHKV